MTQFEPDFFVVVDFIFIFCNFFPSKYEHLGPQPRKRMRSRENISSKLNHPLSGVMTECASRKMKRVKAAKLNWQKDKMRIQMQMFRVVINKLHCEKEGR